MPKYRVELTVEFETVANIPNASMRGSMTEVGKFFAGLPDPKDVDEDKATADFTIERVVIPTPDPY